jgi:hypothetical protein
VHTGLVKAALGETNQGCVEDLGSAIKGGFQLGLGHGVGKMNERSFIVKSPNFHGKAFAKEDRVAHDFVIPSGVEESLASLFQQAVRDVSTPLDMTKTGEHFQ